MKIQLLLATVALAAAGTALGQDENKATETAPKIEATAEAKAIEFERRLNLTAYQKYLKEREALVEKHPGKWIVIAGGKLLPMHFDADRESNKLYFEPAKTLKEAVAAADKTVPNARHRFVFRVGEDGDYNYKMGMTTKRHVLGSGFYKLLPGEAVVSGKLLFTTGKGRNLKIKLKQRHRLEVKMAIPIGSAGDKPPTAPFLLASIFDGTATVSLATGARLRLQLWEIPGKVSITGMSQSGDLVRARIRLAFDGTDFVLTMPIAIWQR